jgi:hypothetical protein
MRFRTNDKGFITLRFADFPNTEFDLDEGYGDGFVTIERVEPPMPVIPRTPEQRATEAALDREFQEFARHYRESLPPRQRFGAAHLPPEAG